MKPPVRSTKASRLMDRKFKEAKCRECSVLVTRMDFAKILGKFTRVKIQYETTTSPKKGKEKESNFTSPNSNSRLKSNENGMVLIHRNAYSEHPVKSKVTPKKKVNNQKQANSQPRRLNNNIPKENHKMKKMQKIKEAKNKSKPLKKKNDNKIKYCVEFDLPVKKAEPVNTTRLHDLLPEIDNNILPSEDWSIEYFPKNSSDNDIVYDKIAAELEELMCNNKSSTSNNNPDNVVVKIDDFPSILDIISDTNTKPPTLGSSDDFSGNSDVEAILLGEDKANITEKPNVLPQLILSPESSSLIVEGKEGTKGSNFKECVSSTMEKSKVDTENKDVTTKNPKPSYVTCIVFKKSSRPRSVTFTEDLKFNIELGGKPIVLLGAPSFVTSLVDLKILLEIVNECESNSNYLSSL